MKQAIIEAKNLSIGWSEEAVLLRDTSFAVSPGEIVAILGPSGSGKSTLLRTMVGLEPPLAGELWVTGRRHDDLHDQRPPFGVMFQSGALFGSVSLLDNACLPLVEWTRLPREVITSIGRDKLRLVGLEGSEDKLPSELSGGMKKRAALARAIALEPPLIFLDEPTAGLDPLTSVEIDALIRKLNQIVGITVVMVTHEVSSVRRLDARCLLLDAGAKRIIASGSLTDLQRDPNPRVRDFFHPSPPRELT